MMKFGVVLVLLVFPAAGGAVAQTSTPQSSVVGTEGIISPSRPVPVGKAPGMQAKLVEDTPQEKVYAIIFREGDEALSGLTDFAIAHGVKDAHFTAIGAAQSATLAWLDLSKKSYRKIAVGEQCEVLSLIGDIAEFGGKPVVHMHTVLGKPDGGTVGGHVFELNVRPTLEVFLTESTSPLEKKADDASGMKLIDPAE
ncbi:MAG: PPC domain-containing DNA-binding protein [Candidatus Acidiferrales bacterium]